MGIGPPLVEEEEVEELRGMLGKGSYSEPDLSRICNDDDDGQCDECEADSGLQGDMYGGIFSSSPAGRRENWLFHARELAWSPCG